MACRDQMYMYVASTLRAALTVKHCVSSRCHMHLCNAACKACCQLTGSMMSCLSLCSRFWSAKRFTGLFIFWQASISECWKPSSISFSWKAWIHEILSTEIVNELRNQKPHGILAHAWLFAVHILSLCWE